MSGQRSLFDPSAENGTAAAFRKRSDASRAGAAKVNQTLGARQARVLRVIREGGKAGATCAEVSAAIGVPMHGCSGRIRELALRGAIYDSGERRENPASGVSGTVWRVA